MDNRPAKCGKRKAFGFRISNRLYRLSWSATFEIWYLYLLLNLHVCSDPYFELYFSSQPCISYILSIKIRNLLRMPERRAKFHLTIYSSTSREINGNIRASHENTTFCV